MPPSQKKKKKKLQHYITILVLNLYIEFQQTTLLWSFNKLKEIIDIYIKKKNVIALNIAFSKIGLKIIKY